MAIYDRQQGIASRVASAKNDLEETKQSQAVGNDNLIIKHYQESRTGDEILASTPATFKATFTLTKPSDTYVSMQFYWFTSDPASYAQDIWEDETTVSATDEHISYIKIAVSADVTLSTFLAIVNSTASGTLVLERL
jgi:hypothetical protein